MIGRVAGGPALPAGAPGPGRHGLAGLAPGPDAERLSGQLLGLSRAPSRGEGTGSGSACRRAGQLHAARVVAVAGQEVEWTGRVAGRRPGVPAPGPPPDSAWPQACRFKVPADQVLVEPEEEEGSPASTGSLVLVAQDQIIGRAWAQYYPVWDRRLL